jgi:hypothetical protein
MGLEKLLFPAESLKSREIREETSSRRNASRTTPFNRRKTPIESAPTESLITCACPATLGAAAIGWEKALGTSELFGENVTRGREAMPFEKAMRSLVAHAALQEQPIDATCGGALLDLPKQLRANSQ